jgi:hypothetical protein
LRHIVKVSIGFIAVAALSRASTNSGSPASPVTESPSVASHPESPVHRASAGGNFPSGCFSLGEGC